MSRVVRRQLLPVLLGPPDELRFGQARVVGVIVADERAAHQQHVLAGLLLELALAARTVDEAETLGHHLESTLETLVAVLLRLGAAVVVHVPYFAASWGMIFIRNSIDIY